jgi:hypothetical protein
MDLDDIASAIESIPATVVGAIVFVVVSYFAAVTYGWLIQQLAAMGSPWYIWLMAIIIIGGTYATELKEVLAGGILFSVIAGYLAIQIQDWLSLGVIVSAWFVFIGIVWLKSKLADY